MNHTHTPSSLFLPPSVSFILPVVSLGLMRGHFPDAMCHFFSQVTRTPEPGNHSVSSFHLSNHTFLPLHLLFGWLLPFIFALFIDSISLLHFLSVCVPVASPLPSHLSIFLSFLGFSPSARVELNRFLPASVTCLFSMTKTFHSTIRVSSILLQTHTS